MEKGYFKLDEREVNNNLMDERDVIQTSDTESEWMNFLLALSDLTIDEVVKKDKKK